MRNNDNAAKLKARAFRKEMSPAEVVLWSRLKGKQLGVVVKRQYPIGPYFLDFYVPRLALAIEVDGATHIYRGDHDLTRETFLILQGLTIYRIPASEIGKNLAKVVTELEAAISHLNRNEQS